MIFYVSIRPIRLETRLVSPKEHLKNAYPGMDVKFTCLAQGNEDDGRWLYEIECNGESARDVIIEGLQMWGVHLKTLTSAKALAELLTGVTCNIERGRILPVQIGSGV